MKRKQRKGEPKACRAKNRAERPQSESSSHEESSASPANAVEPLTSNERKRLHQLEHAISSGLSSFLEVGRSLAEVRDSRLYREVAASFEDYCAQQWGISRQQGYRLINAADCYDHLESKLPKGKPLPTNESQLRPLVENLDRNQWAKAWNQVIVDVDEGGGMTAEDVKKAVRRSNGKSSHSERAVKRARPKVSKEAVVQIMKVADDALGKARATADELRRVLTKIRNSLKKLSTGFVS